MMSNDSDLAAFLCGDLDIEEFKKRYQERLNKIVASPPNPQSIIDTITLAIQRSSNPNLKKGGIVMKHSKETQFYNGKTVKEEYYTVGFNKDTFLTSVDTFSGLPPLDIKMFKGAVKEDDVFKTTSNDSVVIGTIPPQ